MYTRHTKCKMLQEKISQNYESFEDQIKNSNYWIIYTMYRKDGIN